MQTPICFHWTWPKAHKKHLCYDKQNFELLYMTVQRIQACTFYKNVWKSNAASIFAFKHLKPVLEYIYTSCLHHDHMWESVIATYIITLIENKTWNCLLLDQFQPLLTIINEIRIHFSIAHLHNKACHNTDQHYNIQVL